MRCFHCPRFYHTKPRRNRRSPLIRLQRTGFTVLKNFDYSTTGSYPQAELMQGTDSNLYGTTRYGGDANDGTVFRLVCSAPDVTPLVLSGVPSDIIAEATWPEDAIVSFPTPTANDAVDGARPVVCAPLSGTTFALGITPVTCTASDTHGNTVSGSFSVTVRTYTADDPLRNDATIAVSKFGSSI